MTEIGRGVKKRFPARIWALAGSGLVCILAAGGLAFENGNSADPAHDATFKLRSVSVFKSGQNDFLRGQMCRCQTEPYAAVRHYPAFVSRVPIYGSVKFGGRWDDPNSGSTFYFALDESQGTGKGYDRLYFDRNCDLDLRNDSPVKAPSSPPDGGYKPNFSGIKSVTCFDFLDLDLATNKGSAQRLEVMPRLLLTGDETSTYRFLFFVRTHLFEGDIEIAGEKFHAVLGNDYAVAPDLNSPGTALKLSGGNGYFDWWGGDRISAMHNLGGHYYSFSASPEGALTVHPYAGDLGFFEAGPGFRTLTNFTVTGSLESKGWAVAIGGEAKDGRPAAARACKIPAGDYLPEFLTIQYGRLRIQLSQNYHSEGKRQSRDGRPDVYGIKVRSGQTYDLDFSSQPVVMFTSPTNSQRIKAGEELSVMAVLTDPKLDIMIRRLEDTSRKETKDASGKDLGYERNVSLDPRVIITRTNGEKVAEGVMPFG